MWQDPIVEEVREIREQQALAFGWDIWAMYVYLKELEKASEREVISFTPKPLMQIKLEIETPAPSV